MTSRERQNVTLLLNRSTLQRSRGTDGSATRLEGDLPADELDEQRHSRGELRPSVRFCSLTHAVAGRYPRRSFRFALRNFSVARHVRLDRIAASAASDDAVLLTVLVNTVGMPITCWKKSISALAKPSHERAAIAR